VRYRIYADFNSGTFDTGFWCLRYGDEMRPLDEVAEQLQLYPGLRVTLFHADEIEEFECSATLELSATMPARWVARADFSSLTYLRTGADSKSPKN